MTKIIATMAAFGGAMMLAGCGEQQAAPIVIDETAVAERASYIAADFRNELSSTLFAAMEAGGPVEGIGVCHEAATRIAASQSEASGAEIRRIADKHRNPAGGVPDEARPYYDELAGDPMGNNGPANRIWTSGSAEQGKVHFLAAIAMMDQPCSTCHGTNIAPEVQAKIDELYPQDQATGFAEGDLRGALWITWDASVFAK